MNIARKGVLLLLVWQCAIIAASREQQQKAQEIAFQTDLNSEPWPDSLSSFVWDFSQELVNDPLIADRDPLELVDALVHVRNARNATAMREMRAITGSKFSEYVSHNTFAIVAPAGVFAKCACYSAAAFLKLPLLSCFPVMFIWFT
jgi:hypothetical protein